MTREERIEGFKREVQLYARSARASEEAGQHERARSYLLLMDMAEQDLRKEMEAAR